MVSSGRPDSLPRGKRPRPARGRPLIIGLAFSLAAPSARAVDFSSSNLPIVAVDTHGRQIENDRRIDAGMGVIDQGPGMRNRADGPFSGYEGAIRIEIRGSSAVWQGWPKQSYAFETVDASGDALDVPLLGMPEENDWILYGPYTDKTYLRDALAYRIAAGMGRYAPRTRFCELVINGRYRGVYLVIEKIKRDRNRVDVAKMDPDDSGGDAVTGGYIIKVDRPAGEENAGWTSALSPSPDAGNKVRYLYHYPRPADITAEQKTEIRRFMDSFELIFHGNRRDECTDSLLDVDAFIDYVILNELTRNVDAYSLSTYLHKDRDSRDGRLKMGPAWDYNLGFGNADYYAGDSTAGWMIDRKVRLRDRIPFWIGTLWGDAGVRERFARRYRDLRRNGILSTDRIPALIDAWSDTLAEAEARDHALYPVLGTYVWPNPFVGETYGDEITHLKEWIRERLTWMDAAMTDVPSLPEQPAAFELGPNFPNPFNSRTTVPFRLRRPGSVRVSVLDIRGRVRVRRDLGVLGEGVHGFRWDGAGQAAGVYLIQIESGSDVERGSMVLIP